MTVIENEMMKIIRNQLVTGEARLYEHVSVTFRWLMATLFAANGGAIVVLFGWSHARQHGGLSALGWFAAGLILSILMGMFSTVWAFRAIKPMEIARLSIDHSLLTGVVDEKVIEELIARHTLTWKTWVPSYFGVASFVCLVGGMLAIACRL